MIRRSATGVALVLAIILSLTWVAYALTFPRLTGRVVDEAAVLDAASLQTITDKLADAEAKTGNQIVVVTLKSLQGTSIEDFGYQLGRTWGIGQKQTNNGVLLIVAQSERKVRIEVGYGLEGALTDAVTKLIIQNAIAPRLRSGDYAGGISRGVDDIIQVISGDAEEFQRRAALRPDSTAPGVDLIGVFIFLIVLFVVFRMLRRGGPGPRSGRRGGFAGPIFFPSSGGSWSSGSSGGGFSGGGGSFGGGGSSGDW